MFPLLFSLSSPCYQSLRLPTPEDAAEDGGVVRRDVTQIPHHYHKPIVWRLRQLISKPALTAREGASLDSHSGPGFIHAPIRNSIDSTPGEPGSSVLEQSVKSIVRKVNLTCLFLPGTAARKNLPRHQPRPELHRPSCSHSRQTSTSFQKLPANLCCLSVLVMQVEGPGAADTWPVSRLHVQASFYMSSLGGDR